MIFVVLIQWEHIARWWWPLEPQIARMLILETCTSYLAATQAVYYTSMNLLWVALLPGVPDSKTSWHVLGMEELIMQAIIHITMIIFTALDKLDIVWARIGWHIATYRSAVKAVIVNTDADDVSSLRNVLNTQNASPNSQGYACQIVYISGGKPARRKNWKTSLYSLQGSRIKFDFKPMQRNI